MDGEILGKLITFASQTDDEVVKALKFTKQSIFLQHSRLKQYSNFKRPARRLF